LSETNDGSLKLLDEEYKVWSHKKKELASKVDSVKKELAELED
jgi:hypothetical protein